MSYIEDDNVIDLKAEKFQFHSLAQQYKPANLPNGMELPENTKEDIVNDEPINIVVRILQYRTFDDGNTVVRLEDIQEEEFNLKIWSGDEPNKDLKDEEWVLLENALGDVYQGETNLGSNHGKVRFQYLDSVPSFVEKTESSPQTTMIESSEGVVAIDIETIATVSEDEFDFEDSDHVELLCIGVGYSPQKGLPGKSEVLFRTGRSPESEASLLLDFCDYVQSHCPSTLLTFKGDFDYRHLIGRAERLSSLEPELADQIERLFEDKEWMNKEPLGSLEDNINVPESYWDIYAHSMNPRDWRADHPRFDDPVDDSLVYNIDIPYFGERYLNLREESKEALEVRALHELLHHYTVTDIEPLFQLIE